MLTCGIKLTHDGGVAVLDGARLVFSLELEKIGNRPRYSDLDDLDLIGELLRHEGVDPADIDTFVVDGWFPPPGRDVPVVPAAEHGRAIEVPVAPYVGSGELLDPLHRYQMAGVGDGPLSGGYASYTHASNHAAGAYCTSPFARRGEDAFVLVWDGGILPRLYRASAASATIVAKRPLFPLVGNIFAGCCWALEPYVRDFTGMTATEIMQYRLGVAGKAMAYAALGRVAQAAFPTFQGLLAEFDTLSSDTAYSFGVAVADRRDQLFPGMSNADIIATFQAYLGDLLLMHLARMVARDGGPPCRNLCFAGGCALNIKWNTKLRESMLFDEVWVPPFPNDSGAAIGTASCELMRQGITAVDWDVYRGPALAPSRSATGWPARPCDDRELAALLHREGEPVVVLSGRAELGPRALGNRSILAPATDPAMKDRLNDLKGRARYRPVAPVCLESRASEVFSPGGSDPYMLFEHRLRASWAERIPAIVHLDGTARLQTIDPDTPGTPVGRILREYERITGIPVLCNTSANLNGHGFFPGVDDAIEWGGTRYVWSDGVLYTNPSVAARSCESLIGVSI